MMFPFEFLGAGQRELGLLVAMVVGVGFGFVLERAGFGRADKLAGQFYGHDMTVFKVMFSAIVTAMLGLLVLGSAGVVNASAVLALGASETFLWPMLVGGLVLGVGFIISGYCPGTSLVASASGKLDGMITFAGVIVGSVLFGELYPWFAAFHKSGAMGQRFLDQVTGIPRPALAFGVTLMALGCFVGAEKLERIFRRRRGMDEPEAPTSRLTARRAVFAGLGSVAMVGLTFMAVPSAPQASPTAQKSTRLARVQSVTPAQLAQRITDEPWTLRLLDLRGSKACGAKTLPGAECVSSKQLSKLRLGLVATARDLVIVGGKNYTVPKAARRFRGRLFALQGGFEAWHKYALNTPPQPPATATPAQWRAFRFRVAFHRSMTGRTSAPVKVKATPYVPRRRKKKRGGCS